MSLAEKLFGSFSDRELKKINPIVKKVLALEPNIPRFPTQSCRPRLLTEAEAGRRQNAG